MWKVLPFDEVGNLENLKYKTADVTALKSAPEWQYRNFNSGFDKPARKKHFLN